MAVNTRDERASTIHVMLPFGRLLPNPNGSVSAADRVQTAYGYAGFVAVDTSGVIPLDAQSADWVSPIGIVGTPEWVYGPATLVTPIRTTGQ